MRQGEMVRAHNAGPPMTVALIFRDMARCLYVDSHGELRQRFVYVRDLSPLWLSLQPRTLWPNPGQLDLIEIEKEERIAEVTKKAARRSSRKAKRSNRIKDRSHAA